MRDGWVETTLDGIADYINGYPFKPADLGEVGLPVIRIKQLLDSNEPVDRTETDTPDRCLLRDGDIVFSWSGTLAVRIWNRGPAKLNQHLFRVVEKEGLYKGIIPLILDHAIEELEEKSHGTTMKHITKQTLLPHKVLLPPLPEQKRIVDLISSADSYIEALQQQLDSVKRSRNAVLHQLLTAGGDDWLRAGLSEICTMIKRGQAPSYTEQRSVTVLNQKCVRNGRIQFEFARQTDSNTKPINEWAYLRAEDTLVNSTGVGTLGRVAFVGPQDEPLTVDSHLTIVRPDENKIQPSFLGLSLHFREADIEGLAAGSSGQTELSREALGNLIITIPPIPEQKRIVEIITSMDKVTNQTQQTITESQNLRSGLLSDLLSGEHEIPSSYDKVIGAA